jgi:hypothetical protein
MKNTRVLVLQTGGYTWLTADCNNDMLCAELPALTCGSVEGCDDEGFRFSRAEVELVDIDSLNVLIVINDVLKVLRTPPHVIFVLNPLRQESAKVGELDQSILVVEVVEERKVTAWVPQSGQILDERNLHLRPWK